MTTPKAPAHSVPMDFLATLRETLRPLTEPVEVEVQACRLLADALRADRVWHAEIDTAQARARIKCEVPPAHPATLVGEHPLDIMAWNLESLQNGACSAIDHTHASDRITDRARAVCARLQISACVAAPIIRGGSLVGVLGVSDARSRHWTPQDVMLVQETAERLWAIIQWKQAEETLRIRTETLQQQTAQLRRLASELTLAEHHTRQLLSRVLHDGLQQQLFCASLTLDGGIKACGGHELLHRAQAELRDAMDATRSLSMDLFPPVLHNEGLPDALEWMVSWALKNYDLKVRVRADPRADPDALDTRILLFESVRELIFNAVKYAQVDSVQVELSLLPDACIQVTVSDSGVGFNASTVLDSVTAAPGLGLFSIRERLALLGGEMNVRSEPSQGTQFTLRVPRGAGPARSRAVR